MNHVLIALHTTILSMSGSKGATETSDTSPVSTYIVITGHVSSCFYGAGALDALASRIVLTWEEGSLTTL